MRKYLASLLVLFLLGGVSFLVLNQLGFKTTPAISISIVVATLGTIIVQFVFERFKGKNYA